MKTRPGRNPHHRENDQGTPALLILKTLIRFAQSGNKKGGGPLVTFLVLLFFSSPLFFPSLSDLMPAAYLFSYWGALFLFRIGFAQVRVSRFLQRWGCGLPELCARGFHLKDLCSKHGEQRRKVFYVMKKFARKCRTYDLNA